MDLSITQVPVWLSLLFIVCFSTLPVFLIVRVIKAAQQNGNIKNGAVLRKKIILAYGLFLLVVAAVSLSGFFTKNVLPPRVIVFISIPLFLFYFLYVQKTKWFQLIWKHVTIEQLVSIHLFRFVGIFFFLVYHYLVIPKSFAYIGGTGDVLTAILVFPVIIALRKGRSFAKPFVWIWNIIGLLDIVSVITCATALTKLAIETDTPGVQQFGTFPFSWIPAFAPATIIFLHLLIFKKLRQR